MDIRLNSDGTWSEIGSSGGGGCLIVILIIMASTGMFNDCGCSGRGSNNTQSEQVLQEDVIGYAIVKADIANIRTGPGTNYDFYRNERSEKVQLVKNSQIEILEDIDSWYKIKIEDGGVGYIKKSLCVDAGQKDEGYKETSVVVDKPYPKSKRQQVEATPLEENHDVDFQPVIYNNITGSWVYTNRNNKLYIQKIEHKYNKTVFYFNFNAIHAESRITFDKGCYALCNGRRYMMTSPKTTKRNPTTNTKTGTDVYFTLEFEAIPVDWDEMNLGLGDNLFFCNIRHD